MVLPMLAGSAAMALMYSRFGGGGTLGWVTGGLFGLSAIGMVAVMFGRQAAAGPSRAEMFRKRREFMRHLSQQRVNVRRTIERQREASYYRHPDPAGLWAIPASSRLWERRRADNDFAHVRIATGPQELATPILPPASKPLEDLEPMCALALRRFITTYAVVPDLPVVMALTGFSAIYLRGDPQRQRAAVRAMVAGLACFHAPEDVLVAVCAAPDRRIDWEWAKWLPHALHPTKTDALGQLRLVAPTVMAIEAMLDDVLANRPRFNPDRAHTQSPGPHVVVLIDGGDLAGADHLRSEGGVDGVTVLEFDGAPPRVLDPARVVLDVADDGRVRSTTIDGETEIGRADGLSIAEAEALAMQLAPLRLSAAAEPEQQPLVANLGLADLLRLADPYAFDPARAWVARPNRDRLRVPIGVSAAGAPVALDLKESAQDGMGPHGLLIGATGSGKSELLRTLVLALAATHDSTTLNFVLIDFKGGATFTKLDGLPHTSAVITNLADELPLVDRMTEAIEGEITRREELLRRAGNYQSLIEYERARAAGAPLAPLASLLIICDEFSELLSAKPDFIDMFVRIGRLGRSLGVHLLLASQRLEEGRLRGLDGHLSYRIALRTFSGVESRAVIHTPDAYHLPASPGHGYLKTGSETIVRFKAAYVSGVYRRPEARPSAPALGSEQLLPYGVDYRAPAVDEPALAPTGGDEDETAGETLLDILVGAMAGRGTPAHQVWLPPLREPPALDELLPMLVAEPGRGVTVGDPLLRGRLVAPVGIVDKPLEQRRDRLTLDLSGAAGHVVVVGGPQSGKSTLLRTLVASYALTHTPLEVQFYCLDFSGGALVALRDLPHVGGVATRRDTGQVRRTIAEVNVLLRRREEHFARAGIDSMATYRRRRREGDFGPGGWAGKEGMDATDAFGDVFLVIDGWSTIRSDFEDLEPAITEIANRGLSFGIHLVAAATRWTDLRPTIRDVFGTRLELRLGDPADSVLNRRAAMNVPENAPGRGITADSLQFIAALPRLDGRHEIQDAAEALGKLVAHVAGAWDGPPAPAVRLLPAVVPFASLTGAPGPGIPIGIAEADLQPVYADFTADAHFLVFGDAECGKSTVLRSLAHRIVERHSPDEARLIVVDYRRSLLGEITTDHLIGYGSTADRTTEIAKEVAAVMQSRLPGPDVTPEQLRLRTWWQGPELYFLIDDYDMVASRNPNPIAPLLDFLPQGRDVGLHLVLARRSGGLARSAFEAFLSRLKELSTPGLVMSGGREEGALIGTVKASPQPPGRGWLVTRRAGAGLVQVAQREPR